VAVWQRGYHEHIIRNERAWQAIGDYIRANPANWHHDPENRGP
jgi:REP-associated tyrosine transposase